MEGLNKLINNIETLSCGAQYIGFRVQSYVAGYCVMHIFTRCFSQFPIN